VRGGLRELAVARLLADDTAGGTHRPRHTLLAEAVAGGLLPGERAVLHERTARALAATGEETLAAEVAGHWQAASCPAEELPVRVAAAEAAERVFGYAEAAVHWQRAIELARARPGAMDAAGIDVLALYLQAIDALEWSGMGVRAEEVAEEALHRFAGVPDPATAAAVRHRAAVYRGIENPAAGLVLIEEALRLFDQAPLSGEQATAWFDYADILLQSPKELLAEISAALNRARWAASRRPALVTTLRREMLDRILILGERHLALVIREYVTHYNSHRPHQSRQQRPPDIETQHVRDAASLRFVRRKPVVAGAVNEYHLAA
jgi:hypothetical protein